jgi:hypothetical protein
MSHSLPALVLEEAVEVLDELGAWLRLADACPTCATLQGCSHLGRCPLGRVARLRCLLGSVDPQRREDALVALRRERGELGMPAGNRLVPAPSGAAVTPPSVASELPPATLPLLEPGAATRPGVDTAPIRAPLTSPSAHHLGQRVLRLVLLAWRPTRGRRLPRRAVLCLPRELEERGLLAPRPRDVVASKAGAP